MNLQHHRLPPVGQTVDQGDPPQRATAIQTPGGKVATDSVEFLRPTRLRKNHMTKVRSKLKAGVLNEHRLGQAERHRNDSPPECRKLIKPGGEVPAHILKGKGTTGVCPKQSDSDALHRLLSHLKAKESRIQTAEPAHGWIGRPPKTQGSSSLSSWVQNAETHREAPSFHECAGAAAT
jgi:hypothetical protein